MKDIIIYKQNNDTHTHTRIIKKKLPNDQCPQTLKHNIIRIPTIVSTFFVSYIYINTFHRLTHGTHYTAAVTLHRT